MKRCLLLLVMWGIAQSGFAQTRVLTFEEAIKIALKNSLLLQIQRNNLEFSQAQKLSGIASLGPNVNANAGMSRFSGNSFNSQTGEVIIGINDNVNGSLNANIVLFNGFSSINFMRATLANLDAQTYMVQRTTQDVMSLVATQYLRVLLDTELEIIARENHEAQAKLLEQIKAQLALGSKSPVDEYNQDALTKASEYRAVLSQVNVDNDRAVLAQTLMLDAIAEPFEVQKPAWDAGAVINRSLNLDSLVELAKQHRGDYLQAAKLEEAAKRFTAMNFGNMTPNIIGIANLGSSYNFQHDVPTQVEDQNGQLVPNPGYPRPFSEQFQTNNFFKQFGVRVDIPILNGFRNRSAYVQSKVQYRNAQMTHKSLTTQLRNDILRAVRTYEGSRKAYLVSIDQLTAAENAFRFETERFNLGVTNFVDYTTANRALVQAQTDKAQAEYNLVFQKILVDYAVGTLQPEDVTQE